MLQIIEKSLKEKLLKKVLKNCYVIINNSCFDPSLYWGKQRVQDTSLKTPQDIYKNSLKSITNSDHQFLTPLGLGLKPYYFLLPPGLLDVETLRFRPPPTYF